MAGLALPVDLSVMTIIITYKIYIVPYIMCKLIALRHFTNIKVERVLHFLMVSGRLFLNTDIIWARNSHSPLNTFIAPSWNVKEYKYHNYFTL